MSLCPITYEESGSGKYSKKGFRKLSPRLHALNDFPYSAEKQRQEAVVRAEKMSIQGVQLKLSAKLNVKKAVFEITDRGGRYILKPQHATFPELPQNEDLTMRMAAVVNIEVPLHGLIYCQDGSFTYFIKRFDRAGHSKKLAVEDFAQLANRNRDTKYDFSIEKLIPLLNHCTFPVVERVKLFDRLIFNYLVGNEDMHLKNFSLIRREGKSELSPAYDFLNTTIAYLALGKSLNDVEEVALPLNGKKKRLTRKMWVNYFAVKCLGLRGKIIDNTMAKFSGAFPEWEELVQKSFMSESMKEMYVSLLNQRRKVLQL